MEASRLRRRFQNLKIRFLLLASIAAGLIWLRWYTGSVAPHVFGRQIALRPHTSRRIGDDPESTPMFRSQNSSAFIEEEEEEEEDEANLEAGNSLSRSVAKDLNALNDKHVPDVRNGASALLTEPYHHQTIFQQDFKEMMQKLKIFVYPHSHNHPFRNIFEPIAGEPTGNFASESYFKKALTSSSFITTNASEANMFYLPFSIVRLRNDKRVGVGGLKRFVSSYITNIKQKWPYWNKTSGADHFFVSCHSITKVVSDNVVDLRTNAIQVVCSSNNFVPGYIPHKDVSVPQVWPRKGTPDEAKHVKQRKVLAFFAGAANSPVRAAVVKAWSHDTEILVYSKRISTSYAKALLTSKFCLHVKGFEVNTARIADAMHFGCVPVILANHYDLPFGNVLNWDHISVVVSTSDIPLLKEILRGITEEQYNKLQKNVMKVRKHFHWNFPPRDYDAFYMVMYELWSRRHVLKPAI